MKFLWHPITMHHNFGLERKNLDHECQAGICSPHIFEQSKEKEKYDHEQAYSLEIGDCDFEESIRTDGSSQYSTPILSPVSSIASFKSCFSTLEDFEVEVDSSSREEDKPLETSKQHSSLEDDAITSPKNAEIEIESLVSQNNGDDFENTIQHSKELAFNPVPEHPPNEKPTEILGEEKNAEETTDHWFLGKIEIDPPDPEIANEENGKSGSYKQDEDKEIMYVLNDRFKFLVKKFLEAEGILDSMESGNSWLDVVSSLSWEAAELIKLSVIDWNPMDPGLYVKIKCVACGSPSQSQLIKGLVFKKNTAHRHMPSRLQNPRLLLFQGALGQKTIGLSSFDSMEQEMDYLKATIGMIDACRPDIVLVEKAVSRDIQESLLEKGITLVYDMKLHRLKRISLCTGSPIISSADIPIRTELKQCNNFHIEKFFEEHMCHEKGGRRQNKTLMFFDGCPKPLGCSILLKGDQIENLKKVKRAVKSAVYAAHHLILKTSFIEDQREIFADACKINNSLPAVGPNKSLDDITISTTNDIHIFSCKDAYSSIDRMTGEISETSQEIPSCENCPSSVEVNGTTRLPHNRTICNFSDNQGILIRHSRQCPEKRIICEPSHLSRIIYYRRFDLPLGKFLQGILIDKV